MLAPVQASRLGSFCDGLRFVLHLLRRSQPGRRANGGGRREGQARPVVFILHDFELFAQRPKQVLLYSLFDLLQTEDAQMAVVGLTTRVDAADLLEKRVRSRFSQRLLLVPPLVTTDDCAALIRHTLALPATMPPPAIAPPGEEEGGEEGEEEFDAGATDDDDSDASDAGGDGGGRRGGPAATAAEAAGDAEVARRFCGAWAAAAERAEAGAATSALLRRRVSQGLAAAQLRTALRLAVADLSAASPLPSLGALEASLRRLGVPAAASALRELSLVELLLLLCLKRLVDKEAPPPHTLRAVLREYGQFVGAGGAAAQYKYPDALLAKAFEHLHELRLVAPLAELRRRRQPPPDLAPVRLAVDASMVDEYLQSGAVCPLAIQRWGLNKE